MKIFFFLLALFSSFYSLESKTIAIITGKRSDAPSWDPESIKTGLTGSEEAVIYLSEHLVDLGYQILVYGDPPPESLHSRPEANPRYVSMEYTHPAPFDIAIAWRLPQYSLSLKRCAKKVYLWPHDTCDWRLSDEQINAFDDVLWISEWQRQQWISVNPGFKRFTKIFGNGINPGQFSPIEEKKNPYSCIYGSNYARGLEILLDLWPTVKKCYPKATLDVYYGWQTWGLLTQEKEKKMRAQIKELASMGVVDHGFVGHAELTRAYEKASLWTYPCIMPEVFCITALKAQASGAFPVVLRWAALNETVPYGIHCNAPGEYLTALLKAMQRAKKISLQEREQMREFVFEKFTWKKIAEKWHEVFKSAANP